MSTTTRTWISRSGWLLALPVAAVLILVAPHPTASAELEHTFECGTDEAPSGPYLNDDTNILYDYDCATGILTPPETGILPQCVWDGYADDPHPTFGTCALTKKIDANTVDPIIFVATVGLADEVDWYLLDLLHHDIITSVNDAPYVGLGVVYYEDDVSTWDVSCGDDEVVGTSVQLSYQGNDQFGASATNSVNMCF